MILEVKYFSQPNCKICTDLKPKIHEAISSEFPEVIWSEVDAKAHPETAAQHRVFTVPVVLIFAEGREYDRFIRVFSVHNVTQKVRRLYQLLKDA